MSAHLLHSVPSPSCTDTHHQFEPLVTGARMASQQHQSSLRGHTHTHTLSGDNIHNLTSETVRTRWRLHHWCIPQETPLHCTSTPHLQGEKRVSYRMTPKNHNCIHPSDGSSTGQCKRVSYASIEGTRHSVTQDSTGACSKACPGKTIPSLSLSLQVAIHSVSVCQASSPGVFSVC